jgi:O-antigen ligase
LTGLLIVIIYTIIRLVSRGITDQHVANWVVEPFYNDHTDYAAAIAMILTFVIGMIFIRKKVASFTKLFYIGMALFLSVALILSYTRASWLSLVVALVFLITMLLKIKLKYVFLTLGILIGLFLIFKTDIIIALDRNNQDSNKSFTKHLTSMTNISTDASNVERLNRWNCAIRMFRVHPVFGYGPGTYQFKYAPFQKFSEMTIISTNNGDVGNAHSEYLGPLAESGVLGTLTLLIILITTMATASRLYFKSHRRKVRLLALTLLLGLISYYSHGIMNDFLDTDKLSALFWGFTAMIVALDVYHNKQEEKILKE